MSILKKLSVLVLMACFSIPAFAGSGKVNINKADAQTLMNELDGVDQTLASRIVSQREKEGAYVAAYDLNYVDGIDRSFFKKNYDRITVGDVSLADKKHDPFTNG